MSLSMLWYSKLDINTKLYVKQTTPIILGAEWSDLQKIFSMRQTIALIYNKLIREEIIIPVVVPQHH